MVGTPSRDEGTYNATGRIRVAAEQAWANAALRPWAMAEPYNSPGEIERGLRAWSRRSAVFAAQHQRMHALYPRALAALTTHYRMALRKPPAEAATLARHALDRAVGAHFVFAKGSDVRSPHGAKRNAGRSISDEDPGFRFAPSGLPPNLLRLNQLRCFWIKIN